MEQKFIDANRLLEDQEFLKKLSMVESDEECCELFRANGADLTVEDVRQMVEASQIAGESGELSEDQLSEVAGGIVITASAALCFIGASALLGFFSSYGYHTVKDAVKSSKKTKKKK